MSDCPLWGHNIQNGLQNSSIIRPKAENICNGWCKSEIKQKLNEAVFSESFK